MTQRSGANCGLADAEGPALIGPPLSLRNMLNQAAKLHPARDAIVSMHQCGYTARPPQGNNEDVPPPLRFTFSELHHHAASFAVALHDYGLRSGQPIVVFLDSCAEFAIALWAAARLNVPFVPLDPRMLANRVEVEHCLQLIKPAVLLADCGFTGVLQAILNSDFSHSPLRISTSINDSLTTGWLPLPSLLSEKDPVDTTSTLANIDERSVDVDGDVAFIVFTSGTSGLPKACPHSSRTLWAGSMGARWLRDIQPDHKLLQHLPMSHVYAYVHTLGFWTAGASVVFPSRSFDAKESLRTIETEQCTHTMAVPTIIQALVSHPDFSPGRVETLQHVSLGGTVISPAILRVCLDTTGHGLGVSVAVPGFGMSEGVTVLGWPLSTNPTVEDDFASVGQPVPGARVKVCKPGSQQCLPYDEVGELHIGGPAVIDGYMSSDNNVFYDKDSCHWLVTGDQARMNKAGAVYILGRYKDIIIRAGENLAPSKIEACVSRVFPHITSQVVDVPDDIAGEVPAAVLSVPEGLRPDTQRIKAAVVGNLGLKFAPEIIVSLKEIGLQAFPTTTSGKVKKEELRAHLMRYIEAQRPSLSSTPESTEEALVDILSHLLGQAPAELPRDKAIPELLDSISTLRFLHELGTTVRKDVTMNHVQGASSLTDLAKRIDSDRAPIEAAPIGPPDISRMSHETDEQSSTQHLVQPTLEKFGLTWENDVQDVYPMAGTAAFFMSRESPFSHQMTYLTKIPNKRDLRSIIATSLKTWPTFRCLCAGYEPLTRLYVVLKHTESFLDLAISEHPDVDDLTELARLSIEPHHVAGEFAESLSFRAVVANVKSTGTAGFVMVANHATYDFLSMANWKQDLEVLLKGGSAQERVPFKLFADTYYLYQTSILAQRSTTFHLRLLDGIGNFRQALWPTIPNLPSQPETTNLNVPLSVRNASLTHYLRLPTLPNILTEHTISAPAIVLTAISIFNVMQTGHSHAILSMFLGGRAWPFLAPEIANTLPNPLNIAGPTFTYVTSVVQINTEETVEKLLRRVTEQQKHLTEHQHVPPSMLGQLKAEDREVWRDSKRQVCNWIPSARAGEEHERELDLIKRDGYAAQGGMNFRWEGGVMNDKETVKMKVIWHRELFSYEEVNEFLNTLMRIIGLLAEVEDWGKSVGEVTDAARLGQCYLSRSGV